jgi:hypothetical protein
MPASLLRRFAPLLVLLALVASACGSTEERAATVNGKDISADAIKDELDAIRGNAKYREVIESDQGYGIKLAGAGKGTFNAEFAAQTLTLNIYYDLIERDLDRRGIKVTAADDKKARTAFKQQIDGLGKGVWTKFPAEFRENAAHRNAVIDKAQEAATTGKIADEYFAEHADEFETACTSHILVNGEGKDDAVAKQQIDEIKAELDGGADFATVAAAKSEDPGSKDKGGDLGCNPKGTFVPEFEEAAYSQPIGAIGDPVKSQFGYHIIVVRSREKATQADVGDQLGQAAFNAYLLDVVCGAKVKVTVDAKFGTWDKGPCKDDQGLAKVTAPKKPKTSK